MNRIELHVEKTLTSLSGNKFGKDTFEEQVRKKIDYNGENEIVFPEGIKRVAISFVQGFTREIVTTIGKSGLREHVSFNVSSERLRKKIDDSIG